MIALGYNYNRFFKVNDSTAYLSGQRIYKYQGDISTGVALAEEPTTAHRLSANPNPSDDHITINVSLHNATIADLSVHNSTGSIVEALMHQRAEKGEYRFTSTLPSGSNGVFFVVLKTNEGMLYEKVVVE